MMSTADVIVENWVSVRRTLVLQKLKVPMTRDRVEFRNFEFKLFLSSSTSLLLPKPSVRAACLNPLRLNNIEHVK